MADETAPASAGEAAARGALARQLAFQMAVAWEMTQELSGAVDATLRILTTAGTRLDVEWHPFTVDDDGEVFALRSRDFVRGLTDVHIILDGLRVKMRVVAENIVRSLEIQPRELAVEARARLGAALVEQRAGERPALEEAVLRYLREQIG